MDFILQLSALPFLLKHLFHLLCYSLGVYMYNSNYLTMHKCTHTHTHCTHTHACTHTHMQHIHMQHTHMHNTHTHIHTQSVSPLHLSSLTCSNSQKSIVLQHLTANGPTSNLPAVNARPSQIHVTLYSFFFKYLQRKREKDS